jgi:hypothetical protein
MEEKFLNRFLYDKNEYILQINYFVHILENNFLLALTYFSEGISFTYDYVGIEYNFDQNNNKIVTFYDFDTEKNISLDEFINMLGICCEIYMEEEQNSKEDVLILYKKTCMKLLSNAS